MKVRITYKEEGDLLVEYEINLGNMNGEVTESEYFDVAWEHVIEDELTVLSSRGDFDFKLLSN